jgi:hypothetical protein
MLVARRVVAATSRVAARTRWELFKQRIAGGRLCACPEGRKGLDGAVRVLLRVSHRELPESGDRVTPESVEARRLETLRADAVQV